MLLIQSGFVFYCHAGAPCLCAPIMFLLRRLATAFSKMSVKRCASATIGMSRRGKESCVTCSMTIDECLVCPLVLNAIVNVTNVILQLCCPIWFISFT